MPEISVIIPVYNTGVYLKKCVESILDQTFPDFELFLVDDGSSDESPQICDEYAAKDTRVRVIHQKNQGQSVARNNAIAQMQGQWVMFCDSDDWIHPQYFEILLSCMEKKKADIAICDCQPLSENENLSIHSFSHIHFTSSSKSNVNRSLLLTRCYPCPCSRPHPLIPFF